MTRQDWQHVQHQLLGNDSNTTDHHGWSMAAMITAIVGDSLLITLGSWLLSAAHSADRRRPRPNSQLTDGCSDRMGSRR